jgi:hypothetical protein
VEQQTSILEAEHIEMSNPQYPVYIISKGRWENPLTSKALEKIGVPYHIVIEPQEYDSYASVIDPKKILVLPFSNLGQGSIPARNWVWEHSIAAGAKRHWIMDDNIRCFGRLNHNRKYRVTTGTILKIAEDFVDRYTNVMMAGLQYDYFCLENQGYPAFYLNTRIYSCILLDNSIKHRWRGRYNEDTDLSIRILDDGWCTILFNAFLAYKMTTMSMKGGNMDELYQGDGRLKMAQSLQQQHPYISKITYKFSKFQHQVNYSRFKTNQLIRRPGLIVPEGVNERGMKLISNCEVEPENPWLCMKKEKPVATRRHR